jgi:isopentenyl-diphosphate Delta-isomerase
MELERLVLVDEEDREVGIAGKLAAHEDGLLHRAFSVFVVSGSGELLIQKRAASKYHSGGLWSNACCGHPRPGEPLLAAAHRRLREEMGFDCALAPLSRVRYRLPLENGLVENELDHVVVGEWDGAPAPDPREAEGWRWIGRDALEAWMAEAPGEFTDWFRLILGALGGLIRAPQEPQELRRAAAGASRIPPSCR